MLNIDRLNSNGCDCLYISFREALVQGAGLVKDSMGAQPDLLVPVPDVQALRHAGVDYINSVLDAGNAHPSLLYEGVLQHLQVEYGCADFAQVRATWEDDQRGTAWGTDICLAALCYRYGVKATVYIVPQANYHTSNLALGRTFYEPSDAHTDICILSADLHFEPLTAIPAQIRMVHGRNYNSNNFRLLTQPHSSDSEQPSSQDAPARAAPPAPRPQPAQAVVQDTNAEATDYEQRFFRPNLPRKRTPKRHCASVTIARRGGDLEVQFVNRYRAWLVANQHLLLGSSATTERGDTMAHLHIQSALHLDVISTGDSTSILSAWLRHDLQLPAGENYMVTVNLHPITKSSHVQWEPQAGYTMKDLGTPAFSIIFQHGHSQRWFRNAMYAHEAIRAAAPYYKRTHLNPTNLGDVLVQYERKNLWPGRVFMHSTQVLRLMLLEKTHSLSGKFLAKNMDMVGLEALRSLEYELFCDRNVDIAHVHDVFHATDFKGHLHKDLDGTLAEELSYAFGAMRKTEWDDISVTDLKRYVRQQQANLRGQGSSGSSDASGDADASGASHGDAAAANLNADRSDSAEDVDIDDMT